MIRLRLANWSLLAGLALAAGCASPCCGPPWSRFSLRSRAVECPCEGGSCGACGGCGGGLEEGPLLGDPGAYPVGPGPYPVGPGPYPTGPYPATPAAPALPPGAVETAPPSTLPPGLVPPGPQTAPPPLAPNGSLPGSAQPFPAAPSSRSRR
jgi:hypothetical protein